LIDIVSRRATSQCLFGRVKTKTAVYHSQLFKYQKHFTQQDV
jgi:hypothetical protein